MKRKLRYYIINKPYGVLSQFTDNSGRKTLKDLNFAFPYDVYPVGRLDYDSEGLLILTNDNKLKSFLIDPVSKVEKEYHVQVERIPSENDLKKLLEGVVCGENFFKAKKAEILNDVFYPERIPPIRFRKNVPTQWISITITEGKNRQVRKMTAAIGFPTLRLIRVRIANICLDFGNPGAGEVLEINRDEIYHKTGYYSRITK